eukprot:56561-Lingulodinium_polyedra.AAC.1
MEPGKSLGRVRLRQEHDDWARLRVLHFLMVGDISAVADRWRSLDQNQRWNLRLWSALYH